MASYKEIFGTNIEVLASDPANPVQGQVWYNSTDNVVKGAAATTAGAWATGGNLNTPRQLLGTAGAGTQTAALGFGGGLPAVTAVTESYNSASWTEVNDLNSARETVGSAGTQTSALAFGGDTGTVTNITESWNGTCWAAVNNLNTTRRIMGGAGVDNTSALAFGGLSAGPTFQAVTESWNGTSWTEVNDLNTARFSLAGAGSQTSALAFGGNGPVALTESWNGTCWSETNDLNTARRYLGSAGTDNTSALAFGGLIGPPKTGATEEWNGTSWTEDTDLSTARDQLAGAGTSSLALAFGGNTTGVTAATEEWTGAGAPLIQTFTDS